MALSISTWLLCAIGFAAEQGEPVDVEPFGEITRWDADGKDYGVVWEDARDICRVVLTAEDASAKTPDGLRIEYWQSSWPERRIPRDALSGAGSSGWLDVGDWFQGQWLKADAEVSVQDGTWTFTFRPVNKTEFPQLTDFAATYRSCLKLRVAADVPLPAIRSLQTFTDSTWTSLEFEVEWSGASPSDPSTWDGHLEVFNGHLQQLRPLTPESAVQVDDQFQWKSTARGKTDGIRAAILYAKPVGYNSFDEAVVRVRQRTKTFSFAASDLIRCGHIFLPDLQVLVRTVNDRTTYDAALARWQANRDKSIYRRVSQMPEQTLGRAWQAMPPKQRHYIPLSFEGGRQHFGVDPDGSVFCQWNWLRQIPGSDTQRCLFAGDSIRYRFGFASDDVTDRQLVDGCLPMTVTQWQRDGIRYQQTAFVVPLAGVPRDGQRIKADDTLVLVSRFEMQPVDGAQADAALDLTVETTQAEQLTLDGAWVMADYDGAPRCRMLLKSDHTQDGDRLTAADGSVQYRAKLSAERPRRTLDVIIPYITITEPQERSAVESLDVDASQAAVRAYWQGRVQAGTQIVTPEPMINDFYKAHVSHLLINTEREVGDSDRYMAKVGTFSYGVYSNESCMMISDLDRRGYHERAEQALETWLHYQGTVGLPGDYSTAKGQLYGAGGYEAGGYNQHHGFVLWCLGEHYWYTRDDQWLHRVAPQIVQGCDWIVEQRQRTVAAAEQSPLRAIERGLLPPGRLEDIGDWRCWLSTNVYSWWGLQNAAAALRAIGLPDGDRLLREADAYRDDILRAFTKAAERSPVVQLRDGSWIPHVPPEVHRRGRTFGWITETLEGAIHMVRTGILEPQDPRSTWIIQDFEDNLYLSEQYGYNLTGDDFERYWFDRGGISMQANLLCNPIPYLLRDEPAHFLRAYFNAFAASYFPDTRMMTEHALPEIGDWRGDHYKSSDEANSTYWLRMMYVMERGEDLWLGAAIPRYWLADGKRIQIQNARTYFGPMSMTLESHAAAGSIQMTIDPPRRNPPQRILARFRHPEGRCMTRCEVNGQNHSAFGAATASVELSDKDYQNPIQITAFFD